MSKATTTKRDWSEVYRQRKARAAAEPTLEQRAMSDAARRQAELRKRRASRLARWEAALREIASVGNPVARRIATEALSEEK